jgi:prevent-host-death family protein
MRSVGLFEAKTKLSELCDAVARTGEPVCITRRGKPWVRIEPEGSAPMTIRERRAEYVTRHRGKEKPDAVDFEVPPRTREPVDFALP